jgi:hypothetical protein
MNKPAGMNLLVNCDFITDDGLVLTTPRETENDFRIKCTVEGYCEAVGCQTPMANGAQKRRFPTGARFWNLPVATRNRQRSW